MRTEPILTATAQLFVAAYSGDYGSGTLEVRYSVTGEDFAPSEDRVRVFLTSSSRRSEGGRPGIIMTVYEHSHSLFDGRRLILT